MLTDPIAIIPAAETESISFAARIKSAAAGLASMLGIRRTSPAPSAGPADAVPTVTKAGFNLRLRYAAAVITGRTAADMGDGHGETVAWLQAETVRLEMRVAELDALLSAMPEGVAWLQSVTVGGLSAADHPPRNEFEERLLDSFQEGLAERIRAVGIPTSLLSGAA